MNRSLSMLAVAALMTLSGAGRAFALDCVKIEGEVRCAEPRQVRSVWDDMKLWSGHVSAAIRRAGENVGLFESQQEIEDRYCSDHPDICRGPAGTRAARPDSPKKTPRKGQGR